LTKPSRQEAIIRAQALIEGLPDVQSCRITEDAEGYIKGVHIVASSSGDPRLVAREAERLLRSKLGLNVDLGQIGVVMVFSPGNNDHLSGFGEAYDEPEALDVRSIDEIVESRFADPSEGDSESRETEPKRRRPPTLEFLEEDRRVRFEGLRLDVEGSRVSVEVKLSKNGLEVTGCLDSIRAGGPLHRAIAQASIHALAELLNEDFNLLLSDVKDLVISGRKALVAAVEVVKGREAKSFTGCVFYEHDSNEAAVLAVLDALNRHLGKCKYHKNIHYRIR